MSKPVVMISSTSVDLLEYREQIREACLGAGMYPEMMEYLPAMDADAVEASLAMVDQADVYVGLIAHRYGYIPENSEISITQMEYRQAEKRGIPRLIFLIGDDVPVKLKNVDKGELGEKLEAFKEVLKKKRVVKFFEDPKDLHIKASQSLAAIKEKLSKEKRPPSAHDLASSPARTPPPDHPEARSRYLRSLLHECQVLPLAQKTTRPVTLNDVYIGLGTTTPEKRESLKRSKEEGEEVKYLSAQQVAEQSAHMVLLGGPGSGKSTFVKQRLAGLAQAEIEGEEGLLPVFMTLRDLAPRLGKATLEGVADAKRRRELGRLVLEQAVADLAVLGVPEAEVMLREAFQKGTVQLVLDGLDEVPYDLRGHVREAVGAVLGNHKLGCVIVTCRIRSYTGETRLQGFDVHTLAPFGEEQVKDFIAGWYHAQQQIKAVTAADAPRLTVDLQQAALTDDLRPLAENPMLMTTMAMVHQEETELPRERVVLYNKAVDILLRKWQQMKGTVPAHLETLFKSEERIRPIIERLAYEAHNKGASDEAADLPRFEALAILEQPEYLGDIIFAHNFLDYVDERSGLLVGRGGAPGKPATYSFPHRTFQEYLAGCYLINRRSAYREIRKLAKEGDYWSVAVQLGAQELLFNRRNPIQLLDNANQLLGGVTDEVTAREALWSAHMANVAGREAVARDEETGEAYLGRVGVALVDALSTELPPIERAEAGRLLAHLGDPDESLLELDKMAFCYVPAGPFLMGSPEGEGDDDEHPRHELDLPYNYWVSQHPVTQAQYRVFVENGGYTNQDWWTPAGWKKKEEQGWQDREPKGERFDLPTHPVVGISWYEAIAFTRWLASRWRAAGLLGDVWRVTLPNEPEWEKAARGGLQVPEKNIIRRVSEGWAVLESLSLKENELPGRMYPWGDVFEPKWANVSATGIGSTSRPGCFPYGVSPYGIQDLAGNVYDWQRNKGYPPYPYPLKDSDWEDLEGTQRRVLRGGSFVLADFSVRCAYRYRYVPGLRGYSRGFRIVVLPFTGEE